METGHARLGLEVALFALLVEILISFYAAWLGQAFCFGLFVLQYTRPCRDNPDFFYFFF